MTQKRKYLETHSWIQFDWIDPHKLPQRFWMRLGEAGARCESLSRVVLPPQVLEELQRIALIKGALATTAIEGNTLSEEQVADLVANRELDLPESQAYQEQEVKNIIGAFNEIAQASFRGENPTLTVKKVCAYNRQVLRELEDTLEDGVVPGEVRKIEVGVPGYKAPLAEDCPYLMEGYVRWLEGFPVSNDPGKRVAEALIKATLAHLYLAWIHPFGNGNGRTARLVEFQILINAGVPAPAAHLLSNHYHQTRPRYYKELRRASQAEDGVQSFLSYAVEGFVEQVSGQWRRVQEYHLRLSWRDFVYRHFAGQDSIPARRRRRLVMDLSDMGTVVQVSQVRTLSPKLKEWYRDKKDNTITRDINWLLNEHLIRRDGDGGIVINIELMQSFRPHMRDEAGDSIPSRPSKR